MTHKQGGAGGASTEQSATYDSGEDLSTAQERGPVPLPDMLNYMADMLEELQGIAEKNEWRTLSGLLALSHAEAMIRRDEISVRRSGARAR